MKHPPKTRKAMNNFVREHLDSSFRGHWDVIRLSRANTAEHNMRVCEIAIALMDEGIPFMTEARLRCGTRPDLVVPPGFLPGGCYIEVLHSETEADFRKNKAGKMPEELLGGVIFIHTSEPFEPKMLW
jgi:hypothetical protein